MHAVDSGADLQAARTTVARTIAICFPDRTIEYWVTEALFWPGQRLRRGSDSWAIVDVLSRRHTGSHLTVILAEDENDAAPATAPTEDATEEHSTGTRDGSDDAERDRQAWNLPLPRLAEVRPFRSRRAPR